MKAIILHSGPAPWAVSAGHEPAEELPLLNRPYLDWQIASLREAGCDEVCVLLGPDAPVPNHASARVVFRQGALLNGSAGALAEMREWLGDEIFVLCQNTTFLDPGSLHAFLLEASAKTVDHCVVTIGIAAPPLSAGIGETLETLPDGKLKATHRWHQSLEKRQSHTYTGVYLVNPRIIDLLPRGQYCDLKEQLFPILTNAGYTIQTASAAGCQPILHCKHFLDVNLDLLREQRLPGTVRATQSTASTQRSVHEQARLRGHVLLGNNCTIDRDATLIGPVVCGDNCHIEAGATVIGPVAIGNDCRIGAAATIQHSVLGNGIVLGAESSIDYCLLGPKQCFDVGTQLANVTTLYGLMDNAPPANDGLAHHTHARHLNRLGHAPSPRHYEIVKRLFDTVFALSLLLVTSPIWLVVAALIYLDNRGPIIFTQRRCGVGGKEFAMYKFRTMIVNADRIQQDLRAHNDVDGPVFKLKNDPRVTRVGAILRKASLDELPQLINVLMGQMSIVGPRPLVMGEMRYNPRWRDLRLTVKPGITGLWQVEGRCGSHFHNWVYFDTQYIRNRSLGLDMKILLKTTLIALKGS
ncbi:MAG: sugar transferase [Gammaproteobacteria bacterium]